jgi:hypothetical protein
MAFFEAGRSFFDVWTLVHFAFWFFIGSVLWPFHVNRMVATGVCMAIALAWEFFERYAEGKWPNIWLNPEGFLNAWCTDPLTCVLGMGLCWLLLDKFAV